MKNPMEKKIDELAKLIQAIESMPERLKDVLSKPTGKLDDEGNRKFEYYLYINGFSSCEIDITPDNVEFARKIVGALVLSPEWKETDKTKRETLIDVTFTNLNTRKRLKVSDWRPKTCKIVEREVEETVPAQEALPERTITKTVREMVCD